MTRIDYLIVGAGPTGLGAAYRLKKLGVSSFLVLEQGDRVGGLSASFRDPAGFSWDTGGHVLFSENDTFIQLMEGLMGEDLLCHVRKARIRMPGGWTDYPFQDHIHQLDADAARRCRDGLRNALGPGSKTRTFADWIWDSFGDGIAELFMAPYNRKVWAYPLERMGFDWVRDRISPARLISATGSHANGWGANRRFFYPRTGGIGAIFNRMANGLHSHILLQHKVLAIDMESRTATTDSGEVFEYRALLNTAPLDHFVKNILHAVREDVLDAAGRLAHNSVSVVGIGVDAAGDRSTSWVYFPDPGCPFYRLTHLHNYAPDITPDGDGQSALMVEISRPGNRRNYSTGLVSQVITGLKYYGLFKEGDESKIISTWQIDAPYGYPIPTLERDEALSEIHPFLEHYHLYSRGRFGGWRYEVGNMDHSVMQGIEWANRMVAGAKENVYSTQS